MNPNDIMPAYEALGYDLSRSDAQSNMEDFPVLRQYQGRAPVVLVMGVGFYEWDPLDTTSPDNNDTIIVDDLGRRWHQKPLEGGNNKFVTKEELAEAPTTLTVMGYVPAEAQSIFDNALPLQNYTALRTYAGRANGVRLTEPRVAGLFQLDIADITSADNGGTVIVGAGGRRWKRQYNGEASVKWWGCTGDGVTDDSVNLQAAVDAMKGLQIVVPPGSYIHAGLKLEGPTYDHTKIRCEGELKLKQRPTAGASNFGGAWCGLILRDVKYTTIDYKGDGNRAVQPVQEHAFLVAVAGGSFMNFPTFQAREVRGDGIYINQYDWAANSAIPQNLTFGRFCVINSEDDGRNAMSIISASRVTVDSFTSIRVGGLVGITQPGGLDLEPNTDYQTIDDVHIGSAYIDTAGNFGFQATGQARTTLGGNIRGFSAGKVHVICRGVVGSLAPVTLQHCQDVSVDFLVEFRVPPQQNHSALVVNNAVSLRLNGVTTGGGRGAQIGFSSKVQNMDLVMVCKDYSYAAIQTVLLENSRVHLTAQTSIAPVSWQPAALYTRALAFPGVHQLNVDYTINCPKVGSTGLSGCLNEGTNLATFESVRFLNGNLRGYTTLDRAMGGFGVGVMKIDVAGVSDGPAAPTSSVWDVGNVVKNSAPVAGGTPGWVCVTAGTPGTWKALANLAA